MSDKSIETDALSADFTHEGGCLCNAVRYRVRGSALCALVCHCRFCQRMTGSTSYANAVFPIDAVELSGKFNIYAHTSETSAKAVYLHSCPTCATTVALKFERWPQYLALSRGTFDDPNWVAIDAHIWTQSAQAGVVLPASTDCYRHARTKLDGSPQAAEQFAVPVAVRRDA
ncbi:MAG: glutathione-dependent formaldehyde-activating [Ramlibacter sp.]|uniref:GFA family protein n=1 Tax=Ramlibacter sp. TaxID=1917967 RepID=UPI00260E9BE4|nr:GFA family protein [Ramlibacter sp.]MDB5752424.1 glutathione-dependent formaldehyde-activating [Ramlibacter sp.]